MKITIDLADHIYEHIEADALSKGISLEEYLRFRLGEMVDGTAINLAGIIQLFNRGAAPGVPQGMICPNCQSGITADSVAQGFCNNCEAPLLESP